MRGNARRPVEEKIAYLPSHKIAFAGIPSFKLDSIEYNSQQGRLRQNAILDENAPVLLLPRTNARRACRQPRLPPLSCYRCHLAGGDGGAALPVVPAFHPTRRNEKRPANVVHVDGDELASDGGGVSRRGG